MLDAARKEGPGFIRRESFSEELVDGVKVDGEGEDPATIYRFDTVGVRPELAKTIDIVPDIFVRGIEDVRAISVEHDS